jgi:hypothetical protein
MERMCKYGTDYKGLREAALKNIEELREEKFKEMDTLKLDKATIGQVENAVAYLGALQRCEEYCKYNDMDELDYDIMWLMSNKKAFNVAVNKAVGRITKHGIIKNRPLEDMLFEVLKRESTEHFLHYNIPFIAEFDFGGTVQITERMDCSTEDVNKYATENGFEVYFEGGFDYIVKAE